MDDFSAILFYQFLNFDQVLDSPEVELFANPRGAYRIAGPFLPPQALRRATS